ncbi:kinase-like domain-containing protein [Suillus spraguei]|nr:kinase-like domain-containing protein [Suillus spraguei]
MSFFSLCKSWVEKVVRKFGLSTLKLTTTSGSSLHDLTGLIVKQSPDPTAYGSFGDVWKCIYITSNFQMEVAVKSMRIDVAGDNSDKVRITQRLLSNVHARTQLQHENLLPLLGFSYEFGLFPAMVSPWMHNGTLNTYLQYNFTELTIESKLRILRQVAAAISYLHSTGIVHGDLTANNILIDSACNAQVADHGILTMWPESPNTSYLRDSVRWVAPEVFNAPEDEEPLTLPEPASDIYSFGCIMFQVMTGQQPYADVRNNYQVTILILKGRKPARPSSPHIADPFWDFIEKCWGDAGCRPSAVEVLSLLDQVTSQELK